MMTMTTTTEHGGNGVAKPVFKPPEASPRIARTVERIMGVFHTWPKRRWWSGKLRQMVGDVSDHTWRMAMQRVRDDPSVSVEGRTYGLRRAAKAVAEPVKAEPTPAPVAVQADPAPHEPAPAVLDLGPEFETLRQQFTTLAGLRHIPASPAMDGIIRRVERAVWVELATFAEGRIHNLDVVTPRTP